MLPLLSRVATAKDFGPPAQFLRSRGSCGSSHSDAKTSDDHLPGCIEVFFCGSLCRYIGVETFA